MTGGLTGRSFLIAGAPFGPFARLLAAEIETLGGRAERLVLNLGDALAWRRSPVWVHRGSVSALSRALEARLPHYTDVILFGEPGPHAAVVSRMARDRGVALWVLENGYFRPDWITLERRGTNAAGDVSVDPAAYDGTVAREIVPRPVGRILPYHVFHISLYYLCELLGRPLFPAFRPEFEPQPWRQAVGHVARYLRTRASRTRRKVSELLASGTPYFLVCLQREGDAQLVKHSPYRTNAAFLEEVLDSFARSAEPGVKLVIKAHPLDSGVVDMGRTVTRLARAVGLDDRVLYLDGGVLAVLSRASRGMVVNNSSAALSALGFGTPVKAMGRAIFDMAGLTDQAPLDRFWSSPAPPDPGLFARYRTWVLDHVQVNGGFHGPKVRRWTAHRLARLFAGLD